MKKKKNESAIQESYPRIIEIEEHKIEEKKPPVNNIAYYKIIEENNDSKLEEK